MRISILCPSALALPGGSDDTRRAALLERYAPAADGPAARLLARARSPLLTRDDALTPWELPDEAWLRARFELDATASVAACAAPASAGPVLLVRPVHLHVGLDHLVLAAPSLDGITFEEAQALADAANALFADDGLRWQPLTPRRWLFQAINDTGRASIEALAVLRCRSARLAAGRNIDAWQPEGPSARRWRALVNELQMLWFEHPVNQARAAQGRPALNSLWLEGRPGQPRHRAFEAVVTADESLAGLALAAGSEVSSLPPAADADDHARLAAIQESVDSLLLAPDWWHEAADDPAAWQQAWQQFDRLIERLQAGSDPIVEIVLGGERDCLVFAPTAADRWAFWRRQSLRRLLDGHR